MKEGPITSIEDVKNVKGVGSKLLIKIAEIIETGKLHQVEEGRIEYNGIYNLTRVHGIGPVKAKELWEKHGIKSIEDLKEHPELLNDKQKMGLKYLEDFELRIPRKEMQKHKDFITNEIKKINSDLIVEVVGSFRRNAPDSGDIDVLITHHDMDVHTDDNLLKSVVSQLEKSKYCCDTFGLGNKKYLGVCKIKYGRHFRRLDLLITDINEFAFSQLYFTGDQGFNIDMRNYALNKGFSLSEYGLKYIDGEHKGEFVKHKFKNEEDIFKFLGLEYVLPKNRKSNVLKMY